MLLNGARATPGRGCFDDHELSGHNLGEIVDVLKGRWNPDLEDFLDAITASGSMVILTNRRYVGNGGCPLPLFALEAVVSGGILGWHTSLRETSSEDRDYRRVCLRLLARLSFLSAERELALGSTHDFMALVQAGRGVHPVQNIGGKDLADPRNHDPILHVLYLMVFMYRRYPWPQDQQYNIDEEIAKWIQRPDGGCNHFPLCGRGNNELTIVRRTLELAVILPSFFHALMEDNSVWLLLAACLRQHSSCTAGNHVTTSGGEKGWFLNTAFSSRREEKNLIRLLKHYRLLAAYVCGEDGRYLLLDVCRQRRRRVIQVSQPQA